MKIQTLAIINDDGKDSIYTKKLYQNLLKKYNVYSFLPIHNTSGLSASISLKNRIDIKNYDGKLYIVDGTPVECANASMLILKKIDLAISGPNYGLNYGNTIYYSGTFMGGYEFYKNGIRTIILSFEGIIDKLIFKIINKIIIELEKTKYDNLLNINVKITDKKYFKNIYVKREKDIVDKNFNYFSINRDRNYFLEKNMSKNRIIDNENFISIGCYFGENRDNKEKEIVILIKKILKGDLFNVM